MRTHRDRRETLPCVAVLARSAATRCTPLLASEHARAITTGQTHVITLWPSTAGINPRKALPTKKP
jgi:hypothetical protein